MKSIHLTVIPVLALFLLFSCQEEEVENVEEETAQETLYNGGEQNFTTSFGVESIEGDSYNLQLTISPLSGSFYAAPGPNSTMSGALKIAIEGGIFVSSNNEWTPGFQDPITTPLGQNDVEWVYDSRTYDCSFELLTEKDFQVSGVVAFVIEPECNRYEVAFTIKQENGEVSVLKGSTKKHNLSN